MDSKNKIIPGVLVATLLILLLFNQSPKGICGIKEAGANYDVSYCDTSCNTDSDCEFVCGCGAINMNEVCINGDIKVNCRTAYYAVSCSANNCVYGEKKLPAEVIVSTQMTQYENGSENAIISVFNNLPVSIWYHSYDLINVGYVGKYANGVALRSCPRQGDEGPYLFSITKNQTVYADYHCLPMNSRELKPKEEIKIIWDQKIFTRPEYGEGLERIPDNYKIVFPYTLSEQDTILNYASSSNFSIM